MKSFLNLSNLTGKIKADKRIFFFAVFFIILIIVLQIFVPSLNSWIYTKYLPPLPDLTGQPEFMTNYIKDAYAEAENNPGSEEAVGKLGMVFHANVFYNEAEKCYKLAGALNPDEWRWSYFSSLISEELGDIKGTIERLESVVKIEPAISLAWFRIGNAYLKMNSYKEAEGAFNKVLELKEYTPEGEWYVKLPDKGAFPIRTYAQMGLGRAMLLQNKPDEAKSIFERLIEEQPKFGPGYRLLGQIYQKSGDNAKRDDLILKAGDFEAFVPPDDPIFDQLILYSRNSNFILKQIDIARKNQNLEWYVYLHRHIFNFNPYDGEALTKLIITSIDIRRTEGLNSLLIAYLKIYNSDETKLLDIANYIILKGQIDQASPLVERALELNPKSEKAQLAHIQILRHSKQVEEGIKECQKILAENPGNAEVRIELGRILLGQNKITDAKNQFKTVLSYVSDNEDALVWLGFISEYERNIENALYYYRKAIEANPLNNKTRLTLGNYLLNLRRWRDALNHFRTSLQASPNDIDLNERYALLLAACPDPSIRDGNKALELTKRLDLRYKFSIEQNLNCGIALAISLAETGQFTQAAETTNKLLERANQLKNEYYISRLKYLLNLFQSNKPYRFQ